MKGDQALYRARFAGFQQKDEAEAVCKQRKQLKLRDLVFDDFLSHTVASCQP